MPLVTLDRVAIAFGHLPLLDEVDGLRKNQAQVRDASNVGLLLEENTRLRQLAVKLSNLLGDLPKQSA